MFPCDCGRYVEIWNLVFMQFDRDNTGTLNPLPRPSIDTGMGLERIASVLQGKISNYDTDLFMPLLEAAAGFIGLDLNKELAAEESSRSAASLRVIADHARAVTFLIADGVQPANEGRGYVLRKILRRAIRHGRLLGEKKPFLHTMVPKVVQLMTQPPHNVPYPELLESADRIEKVVFEEERRFAHTLDAGLARLEADLIALRKEKADSQRAALSRDPLGEQGMSRAELAQHQYQSARELRYRGEDAFKLYDTFGLPFDFIMDTCRDAGISVDVEGFERAMQAQRERARASWKGGSKQTASPIYQAIANGTFNLPEESKRRLGGLNIAPIKQSVFEGYRSTRSKGSEVLAVVKDGQGVKVLNPDEEGEIVLDHTPFYADSGGQVGDIGILYDESHSSIVAEVNGCYMPVQGVRAHKVKARQPIFVGMKVDPVVHVDVRESTMRNHTATHLLHAALRETLGPHVKQAGSLVDPGHLRFDFSHFAAVADEELQDIEDLMNKHVLRNTPVDTIENVPIDVAINEYKAMALFGEKYGDRVRVVKIGEFSTELCGGTHTHATGEIGLIKILSEGSVSSGVRRVEAISGEGSLKHFRLDHKLENLVSSLIPQTKSHSPAEALRGELDKKDAEIKKLQKELEQLRMKSAGSQVASVGEKARDIKGVKVVAQRVDNLDRGQMRTLVDNMRNKLGSGVVVLGSVQDGKVALIVGVTADLTARVQAGKVIKPVAEKVGGSGGGRPDMAEAGGKDPAQLDAALNEAYAAVEGLLK
jgi:alanyl-tRNA synthetase